MLVVAIIIVLILVWYFRKDKIVETMYPRLINQSRTVTLHYTNWCGACKMMKPVWNDVIMKTKNQGIVFVEVDEDIAQTPGIEGYPTIRCLDRNGRTYQYPGGPDFESLLTWVVSPIMV
jgi:thiol-disulfide isomerase/thioredoxin